MSKVTLGGDRLGSGKKQSVELKNYERSTHDLSYVWRSTMASGTLVPFMSEVALPGDTFDIDLNVDVMTHPTIGPLFGSYKVQLDVFQCPIRLYNAKLHMNMLNIGMKMNEIKLPQMTLAIDGLQSYYNFNDNDQINPSCIFSYLNIRGIGVPYAGDQDVARKFNAIPYLSYWDIYKNYYANKQEEVGAVIHNPSNVAVGTVTQFQLRDKLYFAGANVIVLNSTTTNTGQQFVLTDEGSVHIQLTGNVTPNAEDFEIRIGNQILKLNEVFHNFQIENNYLLGTEPYEQFLGLEFYYYYKYKPAELKEIPQVTFFPLENIDRMREMILSDVFNPNAFDINASSDAPYGLPLKKGTNGWCKLSTQEGLGLKTYQSDLFNNWISTEWIEGDNGINSITAVDTSTGEFTIDTLNLSNKVYNMLNRIAISGGSYDDWLDAVYTHERTKSVENPMYMGGLIKELVFQEVVSTNASTIENQIQPLGTLAGRGKLSSKQKGGKVNVKVHEPSYIMGIISLTPRIDYSQGNKWDTNLKTMDDFHKPALDEIGFQDLITDQMAWWDTKIMTDNTVLFKSAGKQPAWINYMTNVNVTRGNFAEETQQMWMTLNRRYENQGQTILDLTTYIDPSKFNQIFADTRLDAQNFWAQIGVNITARRKMSAKIMPNL